MSSKIKHTAESLLRDLGTSSPPIDIDRVADKLGVTIRFEPFESEISGVLYRDSERTIIGVSSLHHKNRQRFTIAHELGHFLLHEMDVHVDKGFRVIMRDSKSSTATDRKEIEANRFAAELLMPESFLKQDARHFLRDVEDEGGLSALAKRYRVSTQAMAIRLASLHLI